MVGFINGHVKAVGDQFLATEIIIGGNDGVTGLIAKIIDRMTDFDRHAAAPERGKYMKDMWSICAHD